MSILVTGAGGFLGRYLISHLERSAGEPITAVVHSTPPSWNFKTPWVAFDLAQVSAIDGLIQQVKPSIIYHLAGHSKVTNTLRMPDYFNSNFLTTANLVQAIEKHGLETRVFLASTVHVYGNQSEVVSEESPAEPVNDYGFTKYLSEECLRIAVHENRNLSVVVGRLYSCFGPGQVLGFVSADLCKKIAELPATDEGTLHVGPTSTFRRFLDVRDAVAVIERLTRSSSNDRYRVINIASPYEIQVKDLINTLLRISGKRAKIHSTEDNSSNRLFGIRVNCDRLDCALPGVRFRPFEETLRDMYFAHAASTDGSKPG